MFNSIKDNKKISFSANQELSRTKIKNKISILEESFELFVEHGINHVTFDMVAEKLKTSKRSIYNYFENLESLIFEIQRQIIKKVNEDEFRKDVEVDIKLKVPATKILAKYLENSFVFSKESQKIFIFLEDFEKTYGNQIPKDLDFFAVTLETNHKYLGEILRYGIKTKEFFLGEHEIKETVAFIALSSEGLYKRILSNSRRILDEYNFTVEDSSVFHELLIKGISKRK